MTSRGLCTVIFSKDRPLQLDATIRSLQSNCDDIGSADIRVLYVTSAPAFAAGYRVLANEHPGVQFLRESDFKADLVRLVEGTSHVMFLVDDTIFVGSFSLARTIQVLDEDPACLGFSFRLGRNTTYCYTVDRQQRLPVFEENGSGVLAFDWTEAEHDFGYPIEVSSSIYRTSDLLPLVVGLEYRNPNTLESALAERGPSFRATRPRLACFQQSVAFSVPANLAQTAWRNRVGGNPELTTGALAQAFSRGQRLDIERYQGLVANACHQELELAFKNDPDIPTVSVMIPCYGQAQYLPDAVASVVGQTFTDWEVIIVDDGSPDQTSDVAVALIREYADRRIRLVQQENGGIAAARNTGVSVSKGRYLLPLDADDGLDRRMLWECVRVLDQDPTVAIVYTDLQQYGEGSDLIRAADFDPVVIPEANQLNYCSLYRREVWEAVGGYNPNMVLGYEDWDFWVGAVAHGYRAVRIGEPLFHYRIRAGSRDVGAREHDAELRQQIRRNHPGLYSAQRRLPRIARRKARGLVRRMRHVTRAILSGR